MNSRLRRLRYASVPIACLLTLSSHVLAQPVLGFRAMVDAAWAQLPQRDDFVARQNVAAARFRAGGALVPDAPVATGSYIDDKAFGSNYNYITSQIEVSTPVWLPGEGTAMQNTASAEGRAAAAAIEAAHLGLASQVLDLATQAAHAANARDVAARRLATAQALAADLARRFRVGEASQSDALAADADAAGALVTLSGAEADLEAARASMAMVTGSDALCRLDAPARAEGVVADAAMHHPRIVAAELAVRAAEANDRLVRIQNRDDPQIGLQGINEKQPGARWDTRFGVVFRFSFATEARNAPRRAAAEQATTQAMVQLALVRRAVLGGIEQSQAMLGGAARAQAASERAASELERRRGQIDRAWRLGEVALIEVVRAHALSFDADLARDKARIDLDSARLRVKLAEGVLP